MSSDEKNEKTGVAQKILLVEDEKETAGLIAKFLTRRGFDVDVVHTLEDGLKKFAAHYTLVLLDIMLEGEKSFPLLEKVKNDNPRTLVIMVSGHDNDENIREAKKLGADGFIAKPVISEHLEYFLLSKLKALQK